MNLPPIIIDDRPCLHKRARYTPDMPPVAVYVTYENSVITLTTHSDLAETFLLYSDYPNYLREIMKD